MKKKKSKTRFSRKGVVMSLRTRRKINYRLKFRNVFIELSPTNHGLGYSLQARLAGSSRRVPIILDEGLLQQIEAQLRGKKPSAQIEFGFDLAGDRTLFEADETATNENK